VLLAGAPSASISESGSNDQRRSRGPIERLGRRALDLSNDDPRRASSSPKFGFCARGAGSAAENGASPKIDCGAIVSPLLSGHQRLIGVREQRGAGRVEGPPARCLSDGRRGAPNEPTFSLHALAFVLAGTTIFIFGCLCTIGFIVVRECGSVWGYYGCKTQAITDPASHPESVPSRAQISALGSRSAVLAPHPKIRVGLGVHGATRPP
jgi:hypothetical protein